MRGWRAGHAAFAKDVPRSGLQIAADHPHQEDRDDIGQKNRNHPARRAHAHVELQQRLHVDEIGEVGGRGAGPAIRGDKDFGKDRQQENRLDQDDDGDGARKMARAEGP